MSQAATVYSFARTRIRIVRLPGTSSLTSLTIRLSITHHRFQATLSAMAESCSATIRRSYNSQALSCGDLSRLECSAGTARQSEQSCRRCALRPAGRALLDGCTSRHSRRGCNRSTQHTRIATSMTLSTLSQISISSLAAVAFAFYQPIRNQISGLGQADRRHRPNGLVGDTEYAGRSQPEQYAASNFLTYPESPTVRFLGAKSRIISHGAGAGTSLAGLFRLSRSESQICCWGRDNAHWSFFLNIESNLHCATPRSSSMEGSVCETMGMGTFTTTNLIDGVLPSGPVRDWRFGQLLTSRTRL
jgi:hypothetical protein